MATTEPHSEPQSAARDVVGAPRSRGGKGRIPWVLVAAAFLAGLALGALRRRSRARRRESAAGS